MTRQQDELAALTNAALRWEGTLPALKDDPGSLPDFLAPIVDQIREDAASEALRKAADALEAQPPKLRHQYAATLRLYADEPWRLA
jgi:hypothetical protein